ncbi:hypothetical protein HK101_008770 [Irineochytrium annulatum]|nr:hypothetical protein HK101_008770 [Irineochytrium annulatum]
MDLCRPAQKNGCCYGTTQRLEVDTPAAIMPPPCFDDALWNPTHTSEQESFQFRTLSSSVPVSSTNASSSPHAAQDLRPCAASLAIHLEDHESHATGAAAAQAAAARPDDDEEDEEENGEGETKKKRVRRSSVVVALEKKEKEEQKRMKKEEKVRKGILKDEEKKRKEEAKALKKEMKMEPKLGEPKVKLPVVRAGNWSVDETSALLREATAFYSDYLMSVKHTVGFLAWGACLANALGRILLNHPYLSNRTPEQCANRLQTLRDKHKKVLTICQKTGGAGIEDMCSKTGIRHDHYLLISQIYGGHAGDTLQGMSNGPTAQHERDSDQDLDPAYLGDSTNDGMDDGMDEDTARRKPRKKRTIVPFNNADGSASAELDSDLSEFDGGQKRRRTLGVASLAPAGHESLSTAPLRQQRVQVPRALDLQRPPKPAASKGRKSSTNAADALLDALSASNDAAMDKIVSVLGTGIQQQQLALTAQQAAAAQRLAFAQTAHQQMMEQAQLRMQQMMVLFVASQGNTAAAAAMMAPAPPLTDHSNKVSTHPGADIAHPSRKGEEGLLFEEEKENHKNDKLESC